MMEEKTILEIVTTWQRHIGLPSGRKLNTLDYIYNGASRWGTLVEDVYGIDSSTFVWTKWNHGHGYLPDGRPIFITNFLGDLYVMRPHNIQPRENELYIKIMYEADAHYAMQKV